MGVQPRCFISHPWAGHIHHFAQRLVGTLRANAVGAWIDQNDIVPGQDLSTRIRNGVLHETDIFILVLAPETLASPYCMAELELVLDANKPAICLKLAASEIPSRLRNSLAVDFTNAAYYDASAERLIQGVRGLFRVQQVARRLDDDAPEVRSEAARLLADLKDLTALDAILKRIALEHDDTVLYWLLLALGDLFVESHSRSALAIGILQRVATGRSPLVQRGADEAYAGIRARHPGLRV